MKRSAEKWRARMSDHVAFYSYRWLSWALACLAITVPGYTGGLTRDVGIILLLFVVNVALTATSQSYVRLARRRPALLLLDLLFGASLVWGGGGSFLPFVPYALGALVLPALLFGWRGGLVGGLAFAALDLSGAALVGTAGPASLMALTARVLTPFAFALCWAAAGQLLRGEAPGEREGGADRAESESARQRGASAVDDPGSLVRFVERTPLERGAPAGSSRGLAPATLARTASAPHADPSRRLIYELTPGPEVALPATLEQLAANVSQRSGLAVRVAQVGAAQRLNQAQHTVLLRTAQEALLNIQQHARARSAQITLTFEPRAVTLVVQDDGVGLLDGTYERPGLHSLRAVRYRLAELDGQLAVFEGESGGVTVRATLPLD